jgi:hypothetical protein
MVPSWLWPVEADAVRPQGVRCRGDRQAVPPMARPEAYGADGDGSGEPAGDVRAGEGRPCARLDDRAVFTCVEVFIPGRC